MLELHVKNPLDKTVSLKVSLPEDATVEDLRTKVGQELSIEPSLVRLIHGGTMLVGLKPLSSFGIINDSVIHIAVKKPKFSISEEAAKTPSPQPQVAAPADPAPPVPSASRFSGSASAFPGVDLSSMQSISSLFSGNPLLKTLFSNKEFLRRQIQNSPMMKEMMRDNPELAAHMQSPEAIEMFTELMSDPDKLQAALRDMDSTITQMSTTPGGTAMLERLRHDMNRLQANLQSMDHSPVDLFGLNGSQQSDEPTEEQQAGSLAAYEYLQNLFNNEGDSIFGHLFNTASQEGLFSVLSPPGDTRFSAPGFPMTYSQLLYNESLATSSLPFAIIADRPEDVEALLRQDGGLNFGGQPGMGADAMNELFRSNPVFTNMIREMARNPELIRQQLSNPLLRDMIRQHLGNSPYASEFLNNPDMMIEMITNYVNAMDTTNNASARAPQQHAHLPPQPPHHNIAATIEQLRQRFTKELDEVHSMGIYGRDDEVLQLLSQYDGNLEYVLNIIFQ